MGVIYGILPLGEYALEGEQTGKWLVRFGIALPADSQPSRISNAEAGSSSSGTARRVRR